MNEQLIYRLADVLKTDMFQVGKDIRGLVTDHVIDVAGIWQVKTDVTVIVDENTDKLLTAMVRVVGDLWGYFMATDDDTWMLFFDGGSVKLHVGSEKEFGLGSAKASISKIKNSLTAAYHRPVKGVVSGDLGGWAKVPLDELSI